MLHDLDYNGKIITRDNFGKGNVSTATCKSIAIKETNERTENTCDKTNRDSSILVIGK